MKKKFLKEFEKIMQLGDKSIQPEKINRVYPEKNLFSQIGQLMIVIFNIRIRKIIR